MARGGRAALIAVLSLLPWGLGHAKSDAFGVELVETRLIDRVYHLDARIDYAFSDDALEALHSGVPLVLRLDIEVLRQRKWWWDETVASLRQSYELQYHALTKKYLLRNLNSGAQESFADLNRAVLTMGHIRALPVLDEELLRSGKRYWARLRAHLDIEALPAPLRPLAYLSSQWRLSSEWYTWSLHP